MPVCREIKTKESSIIIFWASYLLITKNHVPKEIPKEVHKESRSVIICYLADLKFTSIAISNHEFTYLLSFDFESKGAPLK